MTTIIDICRWTNACPVQWYAWDTEGNKYYMKYRGGNLRVEIGERAFNQPLVLNQVGHPLDGCMTFEQLKEHLKGEFVFECQERVGE